jgi:hypothetical protein
VHCTLLPGELLFALEAMIWVPSATAVFLNSSPKVWGGVLAITDFWTLRPGDSLVILRTMVFDGVGWAKAVVRRRERVVAMIEVFILGVEEGLLIVD